MKEKKFIVTKDKGKTMKVEFYEDVEIKKAINKTAKILNEADRFETLKKFIDDLIKETKQNLLLQIEEIVGGVPDDIENYSNETRGAFKERQRIREGLNKLKE